MLDIAEAAVAAADPRTEADILAAGPVRIRGRVTLENEIGTSTGRTPAARCRHGGDTSATGTIRAHRDA